MVVVALLEQALKEQRQEAVEGQTREVRELVLEAFSTRNQDARIRAGFAVKGMEVAVEYLRCLD